jgi:hypothetical protein
MCAAHSFSRDCNLPTENLLWKAVKKPEMRLPWNFRAENSTAECKELQLLETDCPFCAPGTDGWLATPGVGPVSNFNHH